VEDVMIELLMLGWLFMVSYFTVRATDEGGTDRMVLRVVGTLWLYGGLVPLMWNWVVHPIPENALILRLVVPALLVVVYFLLVGRIRQWVGAEEEVL